MAGFCGSPSHHHRAVNIGGTIVIPEVKLRDDWIFGTFASYRRTFGRIKWTGQLNVNNLFDKEYLRAGSSAATRLRGEHRAVYFTYTMNHRGPKF